MRKIDRLTQKILRQIKALICEHNEKAIITIQTEDGGIVPKKATEGSAGFDLYCPKDTILKTNSRGIIPLNIRMSIPIGVAGIIKPRSGFEVKGFVVEDAWGAERRIDCDVKDGVIDSDYRGIVGLIINNHDHIPQRVVKAGTRIAQILFVPVLDAEFVEVSKLDTTERGNGGFNSTGTR